MLISELKAQYPHTTTDFAHAIEWASYNSLFYSAGHLIELVSYSVDTSKEIHCIAIHRKPHDPAPFVLPFSREGLEMVLKAIQPLPNPWNVANTLHALAVEFGNFTA